MANDRGGFRPGGFSSGGFGQGRSDGRFGRIRRPRVDIPLNEYIRAKVLRVIDQDGNNLGEMGRDDALKLARDAGLDLFVISDKADAPIAKVLDYGKHKFEQSKKEKHQKKKQSSDFKEIKMRYNIDIGDYQTKVEQAKKFLGKTKRVKLNITLRGREVEHSALAKQLAARFLVDLVEYGYADGVPDKMMGRSIIVYILPGVNKQVNKQKAKKAKDAENNTELQNS